MFKNRRTRRNGTSAEATVLSIEDLSGRSADTLRRFSHLLEVRRSDGSVFQAEVRAVFGLTGLRPREFDVLRVRYDPDSLHVVFDLDGDPRYDLDASTARTLELRRQAAEAERARRGELTPRD
ncbi:MAG TPA: hypothetical protein VLK58_13615 [Conexibacter sp.]|nr:hypothetical protein [Conexibacter sp.]